MSNQINDYEALFNPKTEIVNSSKKVGDEYKPSAEKGKNNVYQSIIRFIPWWQNPTSQSIIDKWHCWLVDPISQKGRFVDCPSSIGKPSPLQDIYWKLKKSDSVSLQKKADIFSRRHSYSSLIQIIKDDNNPELEGKILIWRYGVKIWDKINAELKPVMGDAHDPFHILDGKAFALIITKVSGFNNYDQAKFLDKRIPLCIPNDEGKLIPITEKSDKKVVFDWVKDNSPELNKYGYQEWDQDTFDYVNQVITAVTGQSTTSANYASIINKTKTTDNVGSGDVDNFSNNTAGLTVESDIKIDEINIEDFNAEELPTIDEIDNSDVGISLDEDLEDLLKNS